MRDVQVDDEGRLRCPSCGGAQFDRERTAAAKITGTATIGVGVFLTKKRMRCLVCGEWSKSGNAQRVPAASPSTPLLGAFPPVAGAVNGSSNVSSEGGGSGTARPIETSVGSELRQLASLHSSGLLTDLEFAEAKQRVIDGI